MSSVILATAGYDHTIRFWEATSGVCYRCVPSPPWCPPPDPASGPRERAPRTDPPHTPPYPGRTLQYADSQVNKLEITSDKHLLAAAGNPHIRLFEVNSNNGQPVLSYDGHKDNITAIGFHRSNDWMFSGSEDGTVRCPARPPPSLPPRSPPVPAPPPVPRPPGDRPATARTPRRIWDLRAPGCQREFESRAAVNSVVMHPNQNELISADQNGNIRVWDITAGACSCELVPEVGTAVR